MSEGVNLPLIVEIEGASVTGALMNDKSYSKSIENKVLWVSHPETGRILPYKGDPRFLRLEKAENFYKALLPGGSEEKAYDFVVDERDVEIHEGVATASDGGEDNSILADLTATIAERHQQMPEGSYTTHLFQKGPDKIRKKAGEEAIELVLARSKEDLIYESADLIYHLMVLLESEGLKIQDVLLELKKRHS